MARPRPHRPLGLIAAFLLLSAPALAQRYHVYNYSEADGLPSPQVYDMVQDASGRMWVVTRGGLVTFDGTEWVPRPIELTPFADTHLRFVAAAPDGRVWVVAGAERSKKPTSRLGWGWGGTRVRLADGANVGLPEVLRLRLRCELPFTYNLTQPVAEAPELSRVRPPQLSRVQLRVWIWDLEGKLVWGGGREWTWRGPDPAEATSWLLEQRGSGRFVFRRRRAGHLTQAL